MPANAGSGKAETGCEEKCTGQGRDRARQFFKNATNPFGAVAGGARLCHKLARIRPAQAKPSALAERCRSGRSGRSRKPEYGFPYRGFESHPLRHRALSNHLKLLLFVACLDGVPGNMPIYRVTNWVTIWCSDAQRAEGNAAE